MLDPVRAAAVAAGQSPVTDVADADVQQLVATGHLDGSTDMALLAECDVALIAVPTPLGPAKAPDPELHPICRPESGPVPDPGMLVILQSTVTPGTTRDVLGALLAQRGLEPGVDYFVAFCPERIDPGNQRWHVEEHPKLVGGLTATCSELAALFYKPICDQVVQCSSPEVAEFSKLVENTYRFINISFVNELAGALRPSRGVGLGSHGGRRDQTLRVSGSLPGPGVGGHCIPVVPFQLEALAKDTAWSPSWSRWPAGSTPNSRAS